MVMTAYHWRKLPELIGNSRVQAEVRPTFTLKNCKHAKKQMIKIASMFLILAMKQKSGDGPKSVRIGLFFKYDREVVNGSENREIPDLWGRVDRYELMTNPLNHIFVHVGKKFLINNK